MNRRSFLASLATLVGGIALEQAIPFNRVWSFPKNIVIAKPKDVSVGQVIGMMHEFIRPSLPKLYTSDYSLLRLNEANRFGFKGKIIFQEGMIRTRFGVKEIHNGEIRQSA